MSWYNDDYKPTIETNDGIKAKSTRGDFVRNWWASRWIEAMEAVLDRGRLSRGRSYARKGQVLSMQEADDKIIGRVQGSHRTPYKYAIALRPLDEEQWQSVLEALNKRPSFVAKLLAGEMPRDIEEAFSAVQLSLFPARFDLFQDCSCPDEAVVCKHLAAVHYILAERFDQDPFLLFRLRGKSKEEILEALGTVSLIDQESETQYPAAPLLSESLETFWEIGPEMEQVHIQIRPPETDYPILERLGSPDFMPQADRYLKQAYQAVSDEAIDITYSEGTFAEEPSSREISSQRFEPKTED